MRIIREDLHCSAVRITGGNLDRLATAATHAADAGLEVWLCPFTNGLTQEALLVFVGDCADRAERLRLQGADVVLLTGSEISLTTAGFLPGGSLEERVALVADPVRVRPLIGGVRQRVNAFLRLAVDTVRARFGGRVSYASLPLEGVDWTPFDIVASDAVYRSAATAARFAELVRTFVAHGAACGKPVAVTESGCMTFRGAANNTSRDIHDLVEWGVDGRPQRLKAPLLRDEAEQATYLREVLDVFASEGVDAAFVYTFARYDLPRRSAPHTDLDVVSCGIVAVLDGEAGRREGRYPDLPWEPKAAFDAVAAHYAEAK